MTPSTSPADRSKLTRDSVGALLPGGTTTTASTFNRPVGRGSAVRSCCCGMRLNKSCRRRWAMRAPTNCFQVPIACSTGASARPIMMEPAMIRPGEICSWIASQAPPPRIAVCSSRRMNLVSPMITPARSLAIDWSRRISSRRPAQRSRKLPNMPIASSTSALRMLLSMAPDATTTLRLAASSGFLVTASLTSAKVNRAMPPHSAIKPSTGWNMNMSARISGVQGASKKAKMPAPVRKKLPHSVEVAARLAGIASDPVEAGLELGGQYPLAQLLVESVANPHQDPRTDHFQQGHDAQQCYRNQGQHQQGRLAPAVQHAVIDLHHIEQRYEHQQVDERTERRGHEEGAAAGGQGGLHF